MDLHPGPTLSHSEQQKAADSALVRQALEDDQDWYEHLVEHSRNLLCLHDLQGWLLAVNPAAAQLLGYSATELLQIPMRQLIPAESQPAFEHYLREIAAAGGAHGLVTVVTRTGERRIWEYHNTLRTKGLPIPVVRGMAHDVTEQKRSERLLREAGEELLSKVREGEGTIRELKLFRALVDQSNDAIQVVDPNTLRFLDVNEKACADLGYSREEMLSLGVFDIDPRLTESVRQKVTEELRKSGALVIEGMHRRKDGSSFPVEVSLRRVLLEREYIVAIARDLTERKQAKEQLQASERRYRALHDRAPVGICRMDTQTGRFLGVNPKYCEITGRSEQDLLTRDFMSITHPEDLADSIDSLQRLARGDVRHYMFEKRYVRPDGSVRWAEVEAVALSGSETEAPGWHMAIIQDITERKDAAERLKEYERLVEGIEEMIVVINRDYRCVLANRAFLHYRGSESKDVVGRLASEIIDSTTFETVVKPRIEECFQGKVVEYEMKYTYPRIGERDLHMTYFPIEGRRGIDRLVSIMRDVTERKRAEQALRQNMEQLRAVSEELRQAKEKLDEEKLYLEKSIDTELGFSEIIGQSTALKEVMRKVKRVASSDATVLLLGETGTGKELVARALHRMSRRNGRNFIKMNCAAIPSGLLESELFGHEKGAFTGALARKLGRLELADGGTLFLDEVGEIPLSLQPKLLRVLQDMEFERLGSTQTLKVDFRLLAATNRDLPQSVKNCEFRSDLYYRLNVFPILIPPLRERREDIRPLVEHFVRKFAQRMKKSITSIPTKTMEEMVRWDWPGNIRELENFLERSVILTPGAVLQAPLAELKAPYETGVARNVSLRDRERERILQVLRDCRGRLGGPGGAAARLGLKRTTLQSRLDQLGIKPGSYRV